jgi:hypothetical protein
MCVECVGVQKSDCFACINLLFICIYRSMCYNIPKCLICMLYVWLLYLKRHLLRTQHMLVVERSSLSAKNPQYVSYRKESIQVQVQSFICSMNLYEYILHNKTSSYEHLKLTLMTKNNVKDMHTKHMVKTNMHVNVFIISFQLKLSPDNFRKEYLFLQFKNFINSWNGKSCHCSACYS